MNDDDWRPTWAELWERDHPSAPDNPKMEDYR